MVKVSITLPNSTQITLEAEEPEIIQQVVDMALRDLPRDLMQVGLDTGKNSVSVPVLEKGISVTDPPPTLAPSPMVTEPEDSPEKPHESSTPSRRRNRNNRSPSAVQGVEQAKATVTPEWPITRRSPEQEDLFAQLCRSAKPMGDMRRVVVAAEAAHRFMGMASVDAAELARLFALAGWQLPHDFTQTLRNAARGKFRWLERVPGRTGRYSVTGLGRSVTLGE